MTDQQRIAILSFSEIDHDPRVLRQVRTFGERWPIQVIGYGTAPAGMRHGAEFSAVARTPRLCAAFRGVLLLTLGRLIPRLAYRWWYWWRRDVRHVQRLLVERRPVVIVANEWSALPVAIETAAMIGARVVCDMHEYSPLMGEDRWYWRFLYQSLVEHFLRRYLPRVDGCMTVNGSIAERYRSQYGVDPLVVRNIPAVTPVPLRAGHSGSVLRLVHHGAAIRDRRIERMIDTIALLDERFTMDFMLVPTQPRYLGWLVSYAERNCPGRVRFRPPVKPEEIVPTLSEYDIGLYVLQPTNYNNLVSLPNKIFEFLAAGLAVVIGPSPEMVRIVDEAGAGRSATDFTPGSVAALLNSLDAAQIKSWQKAACAARFQDVQQEEIQNAAALIERCCVAGRGK